MATVLLPQRNVKVAEALTEEAELKQREAQRLAQEWDAAKKEAIAAAQVLVYMQWHGLNAPSQWQHACTRWLKKSLHA